MDMISRLRWRILCWKWRPSFLLDETSSSSSSTTMTWCSMCSWWGYSHTTLPEMHKYMFSKYNIKYLSWNGSKLNTKYSGIFYLFKYTFSILYFEIHRIHVKLTIQWSITIRLESVWTYSECKKHFGVYNCLETVFISPTSHQIFKKTVSSCHLGTTSYLYLTR